MFLPSGQRLSLSASRQRLEQLIGLRLQPNVDKAQIDRRIWDLFGQTRAVMMTDLSGFSRHVAKFGIVHFLQTIYESIRLFVPVIEEHDGILLKAEADSMMVVFRTADHAMRCAIKMQLATQKYNLDTPEEEQVLLCVGLGYGRMLLIGDEDVFGAEVNAASKLGEDTAKSGEILVTENFMQNLHEAEKLEFDRLGTPPSGTNAAYSVRYQAA